jgi:Mrp family chromosome partitioning ATPase
MTTVLPQLRVFDFVIVDTPPMGMFPDAEILAEKVDASMLVVRQDYTAACDINDAIDCLRQCKSAFLGCILNDMLISAHRQYGYGGRYGYGTRYSYGSKHSGDGHSKSSGKHSSGSKES